MKKFFRHNMLVLLVVATFLALFSVSYSGDTGEFFWDVFWGSGRELVPI
ncbi:MAG: hypothetical protein OXU66_09890 [Gammaproteobacteria bacterium]|nr:hypothetical protein [Gammaproteobacteria bacterium]MDD9959240.1 hypothetical protein [Gammaproteobacteria bacterium]